VTENKTGQRMKKFLIIISMFSVLLIGSQGATSSSASDSSQEWHISFDELQRGLLKSVEVPSLFRLSVNKLVNENSMCEFNYYFENLVFPEELKVFSAQEWYRKNYGQLLNRIDITNVKKQTLTGHNSVVNSVAVLPNGDIVTGSSDNTVKIWDLKTGNEIKTLIGHNGAIRSVAVLPNGDIVTGSKDNTVKIWDIKTGNEIKTLIGHNGAVRSVAVLPNGDIVTGSWDGIRIWSLGAGGEVKQTFSHTGPVYSVAVLPGGDIVTGSYDGIRIWSLGAGGEVKQTFSHTGPVYSVVVLLGGDIVTGSLRRTVKIRKILDAIKNMLEKDGKITLDSLCEAEKMLLEKKRVEDLSSKHTCLLL
jgi:WD40 repeat protein